MKYYNHLNLSFIKDNYRDVYKILQTIHNYYSKNPDVTCLSTVDLEAHYVSSYPAMKEGDRKLLSSVLQKISCSEVTTSIQEYLKVHRNRSIAGELAVVSLDVAEGRKSFEELESVYQKFELSKRDENVIQDSWDLEELYDAEVSTPGLRWRLNWLNQSLGSLRKGDFGFLFARPETGKTTFLASEVTAFAQQASSPILWCNNEEGSRKVKFRCFQATLGVTNQELRSNLKENNQKFQDLIGNRIHIYEDAGMTMHSIEARCKELNPSLIVLDQIDKIKGYKDDRYDLQMKAIYQWARELAKKYGPVIAVCQAGGTGEGKRWLTMNDVDSSHTAKQGEADWILGIGKSNDEGLANVRFLNISKNKLIGDEDTLSEFRHGKREVLIDAERARYKEIE